MSRLGGETFSLRRRPQLSKYAKKLPKPNLRNILIALVVVFILRNLLKNDYRKEEMNYLRDPATHAKEMEKVLGMPEAERKKFINSRGNDVEKLKNDIDYLLNEVHSLRSGAKDPRNSITDRDTDMKLMDHIHKEKRKAKEEQLMKDHPDFVPSRRAPKGENMEGATATN
jgi:hypothetical protein